MQHNPIDVIRWIMVIPAAVIGWWLTIMVGLSLTNIPGLFCPPELMVSDICMTSWYGPVMSGIMIFTAALSAVMTLLFAVLVAPSKRDLVAIIVFVAGSIYATYLAYSISAWAEFTAAIVFGLFTLLLLLKMYGRRVSA
jgi:hypothetical protein